MTFSKFPNRITFLLVIILQFATHSCRQSSNETVDSKIATISVRLPIPVIDAAFAAFYLGQDRGIFAKHGIDLILEPGSSELNPVKMVSSGINEIGILGGPELAITAVSKGADIKAFALLHRNSNFSTIITKKESGITKLSDLNGKKVGFFYGHISTDILRMLFKQEKIDIEEVDVGFNYSQFIADGLPAQWAFTTTAGTTLPAQGINLNFISPVDYGITTHGYTFIAKNSTLQETPEKIANFLKATVEAVSYMLNHEDEAIAAIMKRNPKFSVEVAKSSMAIYNAAIRNNSNIGDFELELLIPTLNRLKDLEVVPLNQEVSNVFTTSFVDEIYRKEEK